MASLGFFPNESGQRSSAGDNSAAGEYDKARATVEGGGEGREGETGRGGELGEFKGITRRGMLGLCEDRGRPGHGENRHHLALPDHEITDCSSLICVLDISELTSIGFVLW